MESIYYVYCLIDPRDDQPFYVGKGHDDRYKHHCYNRNKFPNSSVSKRIKEILKSGWNTIPHYMIKDNMFESIAYDLEKTTIKKYGRRDNDTGILLNKTDGGEGWSLGRLWSNEQKEIRRKYNLKHPRGLRISQCDFYGNIIASFSSANHASRLLHLSKAAPTRIRLCCRNKAASAYGYVWIYENDKLTHYIKNNRIPIIQLSKDGKEIQKFESITKAAQMTNINAGDISTMCKGYRYKSVGGFVWKYQ